MKQLVLIFAMFLALPFVSKADMFLNNQVIIFAEGEDGQLAVKVGEVVGSQKDADKLKAKLMKVKGVKNVSVCTKSGTVKVDYDKSVMASTENITSSIEKTGYKFELMKGAGCSSEKKACPSSGGGGCCKTKKEM